MPAGTTIIVGGTRYTVPNYVLEVGQRFESGVGEIPIEEYDIAVPCASNGVVTITVKTPNGIGWTKDVSIH